VDVVSWDLDGTLYELPALERALMWLALKRLFRAPFRTWRELRWLGRHQRHHAAVRRRGGLDGLEAPWDASAWQDVADRWFPPGLRVVGLHPGARGVLDAIDAAGVRQVLVSDYVADAKLVALGLEDRFDAVFSGEELGVIKPSPLLFEHVCRTLQVRPDRLLHLGDRHDADGLSARDAGCQVRIVRPRDLVTLEVVTGWDAGLQ